MADTIGNKTISQLTQGVDMQPTDVFPADKSQGDTVKFTIAQIEAYVKNAILEEMTDLTGQTVYFNHDAGLVYGNLLKMDGRSVLKTDYPELFAKIGYTWGGSGENFNLPNHVDRFAAMAGTQIAQNYLDSQNKKHTHTIAHKHDKGTYRIKGSFSTRNTDMGHPTISTLVVDTQAPFSLGEIKAGNWGGIESASTDGSIGINLFDTNTGGWTGQTSEPTNENSGSQGSAELRPKTIRQYAYIQYKKF